VEEKYRQIECDKEVRERETEERQLAKDSNWNMREWEMVKRAKAISKERYKKGKDRQREVDNERCERIKEQEWGKWK